MQSFISAFSVAAEIVFSWPTFGILVLGTLVGLLFGMFPGLGGPVALALLIPVSFGMDQGAAMVLFAAAMGGVTFGGSVTAILLNTPGTAPNAATMFDGYPMARQGRAGEAIGASAASSAIGAIIGLVFLVALIPVARSVILAFQPPEFFWLSVFGLSIIAVVSMGNVLKGLVSGGVGLLVSFIGWEGAVGISRFAFGTNYLYDGINIIVALLGMFALAELIKLSTEDQSIADPASKSNFADTLRGVKLTIENWSLVVRSAIIGTFIGLVPGAGGTIATFIAYLQAQMTASDPDSFGTGNIQGVIASEAANDAKDGGALLPTIVFSVPGSAVMVVLLGAFLLHGVTPGRSLLTDELHITMTIVVTLIVSNLLTSSIGVVTANQLTRITRIPVRLIIPTILAVVFVGAFVLRSNIVDVFAVVLFGLIGYWMAVYDYSRVAFVLGLILGPIAEKGFLQSLAISDTGYLIFVTRPISLLLAALTLIGLLVPLIRNWRRSNGGVDQ
jgi:putative tricarboxylic transport membrane protein